MARFIGRLLMALWSVRYSSMRAMSAGMSVTSSYLRWEGSSAGVRPGQGQGTAARFRGSDQRGLDEARRDDGKWSTKVLVMLCTWPLTCRRVHVVSEEAAPDLLHGDLLGVRAFQEVLEELVKVGTEARLGRNGNGDEEMEGLEEVSIEGV
jgi:hypothetical protein